MSIECEKKEVILKRGFGLKKIKKRERKKDR